MALYASEQHWRDIVRGRLELALVAGRAQDCRDRRCARARRCLGEFGPPNYNVHLPMGNCPNMTVQEWRAVSLALVRNSVRGRAFYKRQDAILDALPKAEREAILAAERRAIKAAAAANIHSPWKPTYWFWLWMDDGGDDLVAPEDGRGLAEKLIAERAEAGCTCARRRVMECEECEGRGGGGG